MTAYSNSSSLDYRMGNDPETLESIPVYTMTITVQADNERDLLALAEHELGAMAYLIESRLLLRGLLTEEERTHFMERLSERVAQLEQKERDASQG